MSLSPLTFHVFAVGSLLSLFFPFAAHAQQTGTYLPQPGMPLYSYYSRDYGTSFQGVVRPAPTVVPPHLSRPQQAYVPTNPGAPLYSYYTGDYRERYPESLYYQPRPPLVVDHPYYYGISVANTPPVVPYVSVAQYAPRYPYIGVAQYAPRYPYVPYAASIAPRGRYVAAYWTNFGLGVAHTARSIFPLRCCR